MREAPPNPFLSGSLGAPALARAARRHAWQGVCFSANRGFGPGSSGYCRFWQ